MKHILSFHRFRIILLLLMVTPLTWGYDFVVDGIYYNKNSEEYETPLDAMMSIERRATRVLPLPTSPWIRRRMAKPEEISSLISSKVFFCAFVSSNGRDFA